MESQFERRADTRLFLSIIATGLLSFMGVVIETAMNVTFPTLMKEFQISTSTVQWITTGYLLILSVMIPTSSYLKNRFPMKLLFMGACLIFIVGTILSGQADSFFVLLLGRILQGAGTGIALPLMFNIVMEQAPLDKMGFMIGAAMLVCALAPAVGPSLGGYIVSIYGWRMIFWALLPLLAGSFFMGSFAIRQSSSYGARSFDFIGWIGLAVAFSSLILACGKMDQALEQPEVFALLLALCIGALNWFYRHEINMLRQRKKPLLNMRVFTSSSFVFSVFGMLIMQFICLGIGFLITNYSQLVAGENAFSAGCILLPGCLVGAALAPVSGRIYDRMGAKVPLLFGSCMILLSQIAFNWNLVQSTTASLTNIYVIFALGQGLLAGNILTYAMNCLPKALRGDGNAVFNTSQQLAGALGTAVAAAIISLEQYKASEFAMGTMKGAQETLVLFVVLALLQGVFVYIALRKKPNCE